MFKNIRHDPVQQATFVTSKHRSLGGVSWSRSAHFQLSASENATWSLLANLSQAAAPPTVERVKRHQPAPRFDHMRSHVDVMDKFEFVRDPRSKKMIKMRVEDRRPPLAPVFDDTSRARVKMISPTKSKRQMMDEDARAHRAKEQAEQRRSNSATLRRGDRKKEGEFGLWDNERDFESGGGVDAGQAEKRRQKLAEELQKKKMMPLWQRMVKEEEEAEAQHHLHHQHVAHAPAIGSAPRFRPSSAELTQMERKKRRKRLMREQNRKLRLMANRANSPFGSDNDGGNDVLLDEQSLIRPSKPAASAAAASAVAAASFMQLAADQQGQLQEPQPTKRIRLKKSDLREEDLPEPLVVDFSSKPHPRWPTYSMGKPPEGETMAQRRKRMQEESDAAEAEYALQARQEAEQKKVKLQQLSSSGPQQQQQHRQSPVPDSSSSVQQQHQHQQQMLTRGEPVLSAPSLAKYAPRDATPKRREHFLQLFRRAAASPGSSRLSSAASSVSRTRTRTPELPTGVLLSSSGRDCNLVAEQLKHADASAKRAARALQLIASVREGATTPLTVGRRTPTPTKNLPSETSFFSSSTVKISPSVAFDASVNHHSNASGSGGGGGSVSALRKQVSLSQQPSVVMSSPSFAM